MTTLTIYHMDDGTLLIAEVPEHQPDPLRVQHGRAAVIRYWGTTRGRGQLAHEGPTEKTILDHEPDGGTISWLHVRRSLNVSGKAREAWLAALGKR